MPSFLLLAILFFPLPFNTLCLVPFTLLPTHFHDEPFLSHAHKRFLRGRIVELPPSPFLKDIEEKLLEKSQSAYRKKSLKVPQMDLFEITARNKPR